MTPSPSSPKGSPEDSNPKKSPNLLQRRSLLALGSAALLGAACERKSSTTLRFGRSPGVYYRVREGDTLYFIAKSCELSVESLMSANRLYVSDISVGQVILLPGLDHYPSDLLAHRPAASPRPAEPEPAIEEDWFEMEPLNLPPLELPSPNLQIVSRAHWGAAPSKSNSSPMGPIRRITLHHTDEYPGMRNLTDKQTIRSIAKYHRDRLGWADIGYHYLIGRDGLIYEGRPLHLQGAHTGGHNENNLGISMVGNFVHTLPSDKQLRSLKKLLTHLYRKYGLSSRQLFGHRDFKPTECPGERLYRWLRNYKANS